MSDKKPQGWQIPAINPSAPYVQESFDLARMDAFVKSLGSQFVHWKSTPSPIGLNDKGDYRRNTSDTMTSNGYIYTLGGVFTATMTGNQKEQKRSGNTGALFDSSTAYLVLPRFYDDKSDQPIDATAEQCCNNMGQVGPQGEKCCDNYGKTIGKRIRLTPGDRLYHGDSQVDDLVVNKELLVFNFEGPNIPMFPIIKMDAPIVDSRGIFYKENIDFTICNGNIVWTPGRPNPGIDESTGAGRTYSARYIYRAFYYVVDLLREIRITGVTEGNVRKSERMPLHVAIQREYIYHNINNSDQINKPPSKAMEKRQVSEPIQGIDVPDGMVRVETTDLNNDT